MFDELKEVKYFKERKTFEESPKSREMFRTPGSIYEGAFCEYT